MFTETPSPQSPESLPNDPKLFQAILRDVSRFTIEHGEDVMTVPITPEQRQHLGEGLNLQYFEHNKALHEVINKETDTEFAPDTKTAWAYLEEGDEVNGKDTVALEVLGEGASIQYGKFATICLMGEYGMEQDIFDFAPNGVVILRKGYEVGAADAQWNAPIQATDAELGELHKMLSNMHPGFPSEQAA